MGLSPQDVIRALDEARRRQNEALSVRNAYATARSSRIGRAISLWAAAKSSLSRAVEPFPAPLGSLGDFSSPRTESWPREAHDAAHRRIAELAWQLARYRCLLEEMQTASASILVERDAMRATHFSLRAQLDAAAKERNVISAALDDEKLLTKAIRTRNAQLDEDLATAQRSLKAVSAERDAGHETIAQLGLALKRLQSERDTERKENGLRAGEERASLPHELASRRALLSRILSQHEALLGTDEPTVSVIIPAYGHSKMTLDCLISIAESIAGGPSLQLIVVDDASPDEYFGAAIGGLPFVTMLRNGTNLGFLRSCNRAAAVAAGAYVHFLNNDTLVQRDWMRALVARAEADQSIGAVGSKLIFADGSLQEAGGIIWRDGSGWNYGRGDDADDAKYNYVRDVDYISGASLLVRRELFEKLGRFDTRYVPAYFEDSDLCFSIRANGYRVVYEPKSVVVHLEGISSGTSVSSGIKRHQVSNHPKFVEKWRSELEHHFEPDSVSGMRAARRLQKAKTLVMIDNYVPEYDKDSGSNKLFNFIKLYGQIGYNVIFAPENFHRSEPYTSVLQNIGVEILYRSGNSDDLVKELRERLAIAEVVWMGRPDIGECFLPIVREFPNLPVLYDTHDLHFVRERRELELKGVTDSEKWAHWNRARELELHVVRSADVAMTVTDVEKRVLEEAGMDNVFVMPNVHDSFGRSTTFDQTSGVIFIGGYAHSPNVDAVIWLCEEIMPLVWSTHPEIEVTLIGSNAPEAVRALASEKVHIAGFVENVVPYFERARLMVAPLRFGAGLKGKIGHAFAHALPTVTTPIGAEGFDLVEGRDALIAEDAAAFARALIRAYDDRALWHILSEGGSHVIERFSSEATKTRLAEATAMAHRNRARSRAATSQ